MNRVPEENNVIKKTTPLTLRCLEIGGSMILKYFGGYESLDSGRYQNSIVRTNHLRDLFLLDTGLLDLEE